MSHADRSLIRIRRMTGLFVVLAVFVLSLMVWWVFFQIRAGQRYRALSQAAWDSNAATLEQLIASDQLDVEQARGLPIAQDMELLVDGSTGGVTARPTAEAIQEVEREAGRLVTMFMTEGVFFAVVVLVGVWMMFMTLRHEMELNRRQNNFVAAAMHELRTPLATLKLSLETLVQRDLDTEKRVALLTSAGAEVDRLSLLVGDLLHAGRVVSGSDALPLEHSDVAPLLRDIVDRAQPWIEQAGLEVRMNLSEGSYAFVNADALRTVIQNLLDNARKFGDGDTRVDIDLATCGDFVRCVLSDNGQGVPSGDLERIFDRFHRGGDEQTRTTQGTGLGLYIARSLMTRMGGDIQGRNRPEGGAEFILRWPRRDHA
ncbi:MAG: HAMP domain-containing histidine kinase [Planctomycetes bacterium]|nr:HAMP domain-containing histidine kinase [Planctomycetota bacterium]